jgi:ADP-heptose:LPS heptosyltransferase
MSKEKYSIFHVQGGLGKHIAATAVAKCIKNNHPDRKLIVVCVYQDIFINLPFVDRVYQLGNTSYFYQTYIENQDSILFHQEPYFTTDHIHKRLPLIQTWCKMYNLKFKGETPELIFNSLQKKISKDVWVKNKKPVMVLHTNGGMIAPDAKPYMWARDMPFDIAQQIVDKYHKKYTIYQCTKNNSPKLMNATPIQYDDTTQLSTLEYLSILIHSDKRILIDSCLQHAAAALNLPSLVLWNGTSPKVFGYDIHTNIETVKPQNFKLPGSYLFDFDFNGVEHEYPFNENEELFNIDKILEYIEGI